MSENNQGAINPATGDAGNPKTGQDFEYAPKHAHDRIDSKDQQSFANKIADAHRVEQLEKQAEREKADVPPTEAALKHGNEPSKGAKIDEALEVEDEAELRKKAEAKAQSKEAHKH